MLLELRDVRVAAGVDGPQNNAVARYLKVLRERGSEQLDVGFGAVLSEFIGSALDGSVIDPEEYFKD